MAHQTVLVAQHWGGSNGNGAALNRMRALTLNLHSNRGFQVGTSVVSC